MLWRVPDIEARYPRVASLIGAMAFGIIGWILFDFMFLGYVATANGAGEAGYLPAFHQAPLMVLFLYVMLLGFGFSFLMLFKTAVWPSLIFAADAEGVVLGKGVIWNTTHRVPWSAVRSVVPSRMRIASSNGRTFRVPAVRIQFHQDHGMGASGLNYGHPTDSTNFVVAENVLGRSVDDAIAELERLRECAT